MKWKSNDGKIRDISEMSPGHLKNAMAYCIRSGALETARLLRDELISRDVLPYRFDERTTQNVEVTKWLREEAIKGCKISGALSALEAEGTMFGITGLVNYGDDYDSELDRPF